MFFVLLTPLLVIISVIIIIRLESRRHDRYEIMTMIAQSPVYKPEGRAMGESGAQEQV